MKNPISNDILRDLCIENNWFTLGCNTQYDRLFDFNDCGVDIDTLATAIWMCSEGVDRSSILEILRVKSLPWIDVSYLSHVLNTGGFGKWEIEQICTAVSNSDLNYTVYRTV